MHYVLIPGSGTPEIVNIDTEPGNLGVGRWIIRIDEKIVDLGICGMGGKLS